MFYNLQTHKAYKLTHLNNGRRLRVAPRWALGFVEKLVSRSNYIIPLDLKGRFYASVTFRPKGEILHHAHRFVHNDILRKIFGTYLPLHVFEHYYKIIKGRLYANHECVKALYDTKTSTRASLCATNSAIRNTVGGAEHAQRILLSGLKASLCY